MYSVDDFFTIFNYLKDHPDLVDTHIADIDNKNSIKMQEYDSIIRVREVYLAKLETAYSYKSILESNIYTLHNFKFYVSQVSSEMYSYIENENTYDGVLAGLNSYIAELNESIPAEPVYDPDFLEQGNLANVTGGLDINMVNIAITTRNETKILFKNVIDQISFNTNDYNKLRRFIIDWYSSFRTFLKLQHLSKDPFSMSKPLLDVALKSFGWTDRSEITSTDPFGNVTINSELIREKNLKAALLLALVDIYKKKGSPQSIVELLNFIGISDVSIYEWWLYRERMGSGVNGDLYLEAHRATNTNDDTVEKMLQTNRYLSYEEFKRIAGPHWYYTEEKIKETDDALEHLSLPSIMPYFSIAVYFHFSKVQQLAAFLNKICNDMFIKYIQSDINDEKIIYLQEFDSSVSVLELYLGFLYSYHRYNDHIRYNELKAFIVSKYGFDPETKDPTPFIGAHPFRYEKLMNWIKYNRDLYGNVMSLIGYNKYPDDLEIYTNRYYIGQNEEINLDYDNSTNATDLILDGNWDADTNTPDISTTLEGHYWIVSVRGTTTLGDISDWRVGEYAIKTTASWVKGPLSTLHDVNYYPFIIVKKGSRYAYLLHWNNTTDKIFDKYDKYMYEDIVSDEWNPLFERFKSSKDILMIYPSVYRKKSLGTTYLPINGFGYSIGDYALIEKDDTNLSESDFKIKYDLSNIVEVFQNLHTDGSDYIIGDRILVKKDENNEIKLTPSIYECVAIYENPTAEHLVFLSRELQWIKLEEEETIKEWNRSLNKYYPQVYQCIGTAGTLDEQWLKIDDENIEEWIRLWNSWNKKKFNLNWTMPLERNFSRNRVDPIRILQGTYPSTWVVNYNDLLELVIKEKDLNISYLVKRDETKGYYPQVYVCKIVNIYSYNEELEYQTGWNANTNTPDITSTTETGHFWNITVAGNTVLDGIDDWKVGDYAIKTSTGWVKGPWVFNPDGVNELNFGINNSIITLIDEFCEGNEELYFEVVDILLGYLNTFVGTYIQENPINIREIIIGSGRKIKRLIRDIKPKRARLLSYETIYGIDDPLMDSLNLQEKCYIQFNMTPERDRRETIRDSENDNYDTTNIYHVNPDEPKLFDQCTVYSNRPSITITERLELLTINDGSSPFDPSITKTGTDVSWNMDDGNIETGNGISYSGYTDDSEKHVRFETVDDYENILTLTANNDQLTEIRNLHLMTNLNSLNLSDNRLSEIYKMNEWTYLPNMISLNLSSNDLEYLNISKLTNLISLNLYNNELTNMGRVDNLTSLVDLLVYNNHLTNIGEITNLTDLTDCDLSINQLTNIGVIDDLIYLINFSIQSNNITELGDFTNLTRLRELNVRNNQLTNILNLKSHHLASVDIRDNLITTENLHNIVDDLWDLRTFITSSINLSNNEGISSASAIEKIESIGSYIGNGLKPANTVIYDLSTEVPTLVSTKVGLFTATLNATCNLCTDLLGTGITYEPGNTINYTYLSGTKNIRIYADDFEEITEITAQNDNITEINYVELLKNLQILNLENNSISELDLYELTQLNELILNNNSGLTELTLTNINRCMKLTRMEINNCNLSNEFSIQWCSDLEYLDLSNNNLTHIGYISYFHDLTYVNLSNNNLTDISYVTELENLTHLYLNNNNLNNIGNLNMLHDLQVIHLHNNNFSSDSLTFMIDDLWSIRHALGANSCYITVNNNTGSVSLFSIDQINGTGIFLGDGLITHGCTVTYI